METHYFTFGQAHIHPQTNEPLKDYWIEIMAGSSNKARQKMFELFNQRWGFQYSEKQFLKIYHHFPKGCYARYELD
jgi:hypothetical protein